MNDNSFEKLAASSRRAAILSIFGGLIVVSALGYSAYKLSTIEKEVTAKQAELLDIEAKLTNKTNDLSTKNSALSSLNKQIEDATLQLVTLKSDVKQLPAICRISELQSSVARLDSTIGTADIDARATVARTSSNPNATSLNSLIEGLFGPTAAERGRAYDDLMSTYGDKKEMIDSLLQYANTHRSNMNGIYNALVVLSHVDHSKIRDIDIGAIKSFAESVRNNGPKTAQRVDVLKSRLPK